MKQRIIICLFAMLMSALAMRAQVTTAGLSGKVTMNTAQGEAVIGATVSALHEPSGSRYQAVTNVDGLFNIQGMRTGGPYTVTVSYIGMERKVLRGITLQLGEVYNLPVWLAEDATVLKEVVVTGKASKFAGEKTGAATNINNEQMMAMPTINRSITDIAKISPYSGGGMSFGGRDARSTNFTIDGANFNSNFGLTSDLPGGGNPISIDAIEEVQVAIAPYDVRQTNFIGGGVNAITKSGTNTFRGTAYGYYRDENLRGNRIDHKDLGERKAESQKTYGFTLGGPIVKNKLFFFVNFEKEITPKEVVTFRARQDGETAGGMVSRALGSDMARVSEYLKSQYGYDTGSWTDFPAEDDNTKLLARLDWNISDDHHLALRYNNTKNTDWRVCNGNSGDWEVGSNGRLSDNRIGPKSMAFANSLYYFKNNVWSLSFDLNSRFGAKASNQLLATYTNIDDTRGSDSKEFPFIDIMAGLNDDGSQIKEPYISAGYELFSFHNGVTNKVTSITDNFTYYAGAHRLTAGARFEHQYADNSYIREGTGYYRFRSVDDLLAGAAPESVAFSYGFNGNDSPTSAVRFNQIGFYAQDEWTMADNFKLTYGVRADNMIFNNKDVERNTAIYALDFGGVNVDTGRWPKSAWQFSPRVGFTWDVFGDKTLKLRGGTGIFTGRLPLVFFTNMPQNAAIFQTTYTASTFYDGTGKVVGVNEKLAGLAGKMYGVKELMDYFNVPTTNNNHTAGAKISGVDRDFKMPQIWKTSLALDWQLPVSFPFVATAEFIYNQNINAVYIDNVNLKDNDTSQWERFNGADNRFIYPKDLYYVGGKNAVVLKNTSRGYGYIYNVTLNAEPLDNLKLMAAYTHTEQKEISGMPGSDPVSAWQGVISVNGPNLCTTQRSQYVTPDQVIASINYYIPISRNGFVRGANLNLFYKGYSAYSNSYMYTNDMNGDGLAYDLMYIPANDSEIKFKTEEDRVAFWQFVSQDDYLNSHRGEYAEAYAARTPWLHRVDMRFTTDFQFRVGATNHKMQAIFDFVNIGNLINSSWGIPKSSNISNNGRILKYEGRDASNNPVFSMYKRDGQFLNKSYEKLDSYTNCWKLQIGLKYYFN